MSDSNVWVLQTGDLEVGTTLGFDLTDSTGQVLLKAGQPVNERLKVLLQQRNITSVTVRGAAPEDPPGSQTILRECFPIETVARMQVHVAKTTAVMRDFLKNIDKPTAETVETLRHNVSAYVGESLKDLSSAIAVLIAHDIDTKEGTLERVAERSARLALIGSLASLSMQNSVEESIRTGMIGLLHDASLVRHPEWLESLRGQQMPGDVLAEYRRHPSESAQLLQGVQGIDNELLDSIEQVHEQLDGSGYPRGLMGRQISYHAKVLNFADAYLNLVDPLFGTQRYFDADALAYLCHHACLGRFDRNVAMGVIESMSLYPVGTIVELEDGSRAVVVESTPGSPAAPIIRGFHSTSPRIDLRKTKQTISGPVSMADRPEVIRLRKHQITEVLWQ